MNICCENKDNEYRRLRIETAKSIYTFEFSEVQFEITGRCNMNCKHCRGTDGISHDLDVKTLIETLKFVRTYSPDFKEVTISGGEPLLHPKFFEILAALKRNGVAYLTLTTNGTYLDDSLLNYIDDLQFERVTFSISLDSLNVDEHNRFRNCVHAYSDAVNALKRVVRHNNSVFVSSLRMTVTPEHIAKMEDMALFGIDNKLNRCSYSPVLPVGKAAQNVELIMTPHQLTDFNKELCRLHAKYGGKIAISSNEPLKWQTRRQTNLVLGTEGKRMIDSCPAGIVSFNIYPNGDMTPCSLLPIKIMNVAGKSAEQIGEEYIENPIIHRLLDHDVSGKCGECIHKYSCGGCRVRALGLLGDYMAEDPLCEFGPYK